MDVTTEPIALRIFLLGGFTVEVDGQVVPAVVWRRRKAAALVKLLALAPGHGLHRDQLVDTLWPDADPASAGSSLREALYVARRALEGATAAGGSLLSWEGERLVLRASLWLDINAFSSATSQARQSRDPAAYRVALDLYRGELLPDDRYEDWSAARREMLAAEELALWRELAEIYEAGSELPEAIAALRQVVAREPADEDARGALMRLHAALGQRSEALAHYTQLRTALRRDFDLEPEPALQELAQTIVTGRPTGLAGIPNAGSSDSISARRHNLPLPLTPLIGRENDRAALLQLARQGDARLVTLTGPGGSGKTRLALAVGRDLAEAGAFPDGVWLAELASLSDPTLVADTVLRALALEERPGRSAAEVLCEALRDRDLLLILDNAEHLVEPVALLAARMLEAAPRLRILATSRAALHAPGEQRWPVAPLALPDDSDEGDFDLLLERAKRSPAVRLFVERASRAHPAFRLSASNVLAVVRISRRLDGLPLAIELAAARMTAIPPETLAERLDNALAVLTGGARGGPARHRALRLALDWSYEFLSVPEQALLQRLSVFAGGWTIEAAEAVAADELVPFDAILPLLANLVEQSLVRVEEAGAGLRYGLLETVRQYGRQKLTESGEPAAVLGRHAEYCLSLSLRARPELRGPRQGEWFERLEQEHDNLRLALRTSLEAGRVDRAMTVAASIWWFWYTRGHLREGAGWLREMLAADASGPGAVRAEATLGLAVLTWRLLDYPEARRLAEDARADFAARGDQTGVAWALSFLANIAGAQHDDHAAQGFSEAALALFREVGDSVGLARALNGLAEAARYFGDDATARAYYEEGLALDRLAGNLAGIALKQQNLAHVAIHEGRLVDALDALDESLRLHQLLRHRAGEVNFIDVMAMVATAAGEFDMAVLLFAAGSALVRQLEVHAPDPPDQHDLDHYSRLAREAVRAERFAEFWERGHRFGLADALEEARATGARLRKRLRRQPALDDPLQHLSPREREVLAVLACGRTNREIAQRLGIAPRTVDTHVGAILRKLRIESREEAAAVAIRAGMVPSEAS